MRIIVLIFLIVISLVFIVSCVSKEIPVTETYYENGYRTEYKTETYTATEDVVVKTTEGSSLLSAKSEWQTTWVYLIQSGAYSMRYYGYDISTQNHSRSQVQISFRIDPQLNKGAIEVIDLTDACSDENIPNASWVFGKELTQGNTPVFIPAEGCQFLAPHSIGRGGDPKTWVMNFNALANEPTRLIRYVSIDSSKDDKISFDAKGVKEFAIFASVEPQLTPPNVKLTWSDDVIEKKTVTKERQVPYQVPIQVEKQRVITKTEKVPIWEVWRTNPQTELSSPPTVEVEPAIEETSPTTITTEPSPLVPSTKLIYSDDFSNPNTGWLQASSEDGESYYKEGEFHSIVNKWDWAGWQYNRNAGRFGDFIIEEDIRLVSGPKNSSYGLIFRSQDDDNFYRFLVSADGGYLIGTRLDSKWTELQRRTPSEYVEKGYSSNHLKVVCKGSQIEVYANGHHLTTITDNSFSDGYIGGIIDTSEPNAHVAFDNLKVYKTD